MTASSAVSCPPEQGAPADSEELFERDGPYVTGLVRKLLGPDKRLVDVEDIAADIMEKLVEKDVVGMYDPAVVSSHNGRPVTWKAFLSAQVAIRVRGKREQLHRNRSRELLLLDNPSEYHGMWEDRFGPQVWDEYSVLAPDEDQYQRLREWLATQPSVPGPCSLLALFDELTERVRNGESISPTAVKRRFGLTMAEATGYLDQLKSALRELPSAPEPRLFELDGYTLSAVQLRAAADALKSVRGNRVAPALAAIGHPLATAGTRWYIALGRKEVSEHPECKVVQGTHGTFHNDQTKVAIIHRLERLLATVDEEPELPGPPPAPEPDLTEREKLESQLWGISGADLSAKQMDAILDTVERVYA